MLKKSVGLLFLFLLSTNLTYQNYNDTIVIQNSWGTFLLASVHIERVKLANLFLGAKWGNQDADRCQ